MVFVTQNFEHFDKKNKTKQKQKQTNKKQTTKTKQRNSFYNHFWKRVDAILDISVTETITWC